MKVLVTGALGFVGLNCVRHLADQQLEVLALSRREPDPESLTFLRNSGNVHWLIGDVTNQDQLIDSVQAGRVTHILHAAAMTVSPNEERDLATRMFEVNASGTLTILEAARKARAKRVVFVSSSGLYGPAPALPLKHETDSITVSGLYAICKQTSEQLCRRYAELHDLSTVVGRLGTTYGPMERASQSRQGMSAIYQLADLAQTHKHIKVHGSHIARDFCHSDDIASAFTSLLLEEKLSYPIYNVAASQAYPLSDALETVCEKIPGFSWEEVSNPQDADLVQTKANARAGMNIKRLNEDTNWEPRYDLKTGMKAYLTWLQKG